MKTQAWAVAGLAVIMLAGAGLWAAPPRERDHRPALTVRGLPDGRVQITVSIPGKQLRTFDVKSLPDGELLLSSDNAADTVTSKELTLFLDALPDQAGRPRTDLRPVINGLVRRPGSKDLFAEPIRPPAPIDVPPFSPPPRR